MNLSKDNIMVVHSYRCLFRSLFICIVLLISSCERNTKQQDFYADGTLKMECEMLDGKQHGLCIKYYPDGKIKSKVQWENGKQNGESAFYNEDGSLESKSQWTNGKENGYIIYYYGKGRIFQKNQVKNGKLDGKSISFYENGKVKYEGLYRGGKPIGFFSYYGFDGRLKEKEYFYFENGEQVDNQHIGYDSLGNVILENSFFVRVIPELDTLNYQQEYPITIILNGKDMLKNIRVLIDVCDSDEINDPERNLAYSDTINSPNNKAIYRFTPDKKGKFKLCGKVEEYRLIKWQPDGKPLEEYRDTYFEREYWVK